MKLLHTGDVDDKIKKSFLEAESFFIAAKYILHRDNEIVQKDIWAFVGIGVAHEVNHAFAAEMYLKCLQLITKGKHKPGHHLGNLFSFLENKVQTKLNERYVTIYQAIDEDLFDTTKYSIGQLLISAGEYFKTARYSFEKNRSDRHFRYRLDHAILAIRDIIFEYRPEFKEVFSY